LGDPYFVLKKQYSLFYKYLSWDFFFFFNFKIVSKMVRTKVFVGNLSFKTREAGLFQAFEAAGKVTSAQIVTRGNGRSLGYGFVEFDNEDGANKAIKDLNKFKLDDREINVELAKPRQEGQQQQRPPRQYNSRPPMRGGGGYGGGGMRRPRGGNQGGPRAPRPKRSLDDLQPSSTSLFVTNLPFKYTDEDFGKIFVDAGIKPKSSKVAKRFNGRSRGYGFVEFENQADQQKALTAVDKKTVEGRDLVVKVAMYPPENQGQQQPAQGGAQQAKPAQQGQQTQGTQQAKPAQPAQQTQQAPKPAQPAQPAQQAPKPAQPAQPAQQAPAQTKQEAKPADKQAPPSPAKTPKEKGAESPKNPSDKK
jgi:RNA recognition motif-containing protein